MKEPIYDPLKWCTGPKTWGFLSKETRQCPFGNVVIPSEALFVGRVSQERMDQVLGLGCKYPLDQSSLCLADVSTRSFQAQTMNSIGLRMCLSMPVPWSTVGNLLWSKWNS